MKLFGLVVILWIRCLKFICERVFDELFLVVVVMKIFCSMMFIFVVCGDKGCG